MIRFRSPFTVQQGLCLLSLCCMTGSTRADEAELTRATQAMHSAVNFFTTYASAGGGYVYRLSSDLQKREGEGQVGESTAWIEPPATPAVGMSYLEAWNLTGDPLLKQAALATAEALLQGQLQSGGWFNYIEFSPNDRRRFAYRINGGTGDRLRNATTFDDDKSQSCLRFLMRLDAALDFQDDRIHEAVMYATTAFLKAQYPNGAWPQWYAEFPQPEEFPVLKASLPESWSRTFPGIDYGSFYTLNDNTISDLITTFLEAYDIYGDERYLDAARRGGNFFLLAQLPEPQPGWAQQYDRQMHPAWARKFEPPAVTGGESQGVLRTLMLLYRRTGDEKYLEPLPRALDYYKKLTLPDGRMARFYELGTDRPLYFTREYELVYTANDLPTHYGFIIGNSFPSIEAEFARLHGVSRDQLWQPAAPRTPQLTPELTRRAGSVISALDDRGAWVEEGHLLYHGPNDPTRQIIESRTFSRNLRILAEYIAALKHN